jgi:hypothetical protein
VCVCKKPRANILDESLDTFCLKSGRRQGCLYLPLLLNDVLTVLTRQLGNLQVTYLYIQKIYTEKPKRSVSAKNDFSKAEGCRINRQNQ